MMLAKGKYQSLAQSFLTDYGVIRAKEKHQRMDAFEFKEKQETQGGFSGPGIFV